MAKSFLGKALKFTVGAALVTGAAAAAGICYGLKKWSENEDSDELKVITGTHHGIHITKTEDNKFIVDTKYDKASDPKYCDDPESCIIVDISDKSKDVPCEETPDAAESDDTAVDIVVDLTEEEEPAEESAEAENE